MPSISKTKTRMYRRIKARDIARSWFGIPQYLVEDFFMHHSLEHWTGKEIIGNTFHGKLCQAIIYYHNVTRGEILANQDKEYLCSFRYPKPELNLPAYVLIGRN